MAETANLGLDLERLKDRDAAARVCVSQACSYTKGVGAPTITEDCRTYRDFEHEIDRLKAELDSVLAEAKALMQGSATQRGDSGQQRPMPPNRDPSDVAAGATAPPRIDSGLRVEDLMTRDVRTLGPNDPLSVADELMKVGNFRHVVVVEDDGEVAGVISHRDIVFSALGWSMGQGRHAHDKALETFTAKQVMHNTVFSTDPDAPLPEAAELMQRHKIGCLPVVRDGKLVGILTDGDLLALLSGS